MIEEEYYNPLRDSRKKRNLGQKSIAMDMNAMVDLAFLLLTFFMLTTTMVKPKAMELVMPISEQENESNVQAIKESTALTLIPLNNNRLCYFFGLGKEEVTASQLSTEVLHSLFQRHRQQTEEPVVIIMPHPDSNYNQLVELIDESNIGKINRYATGKFGIQEETLLNQWNIVQDE
jgi:biopolymer transport protein ExbD